MAADRALPDRLEPDSANPRRLLAIAGAVLMLLAVAFGATLWFYRTEVPPRGALVPKEFPSPRLIQDETTELHRVEAEQRARLKGYRWVDRDKGLIGIPIDEAMRMVAAKGANGYGPIDTAPQGGSQ
jgi:hypothetical protein